MRTIRYFAFLPLALLASVIAGPIGYYFAYIVPAPEIFFPLLEGESLHWFLSGLASGLAYFYVGFTVAPELRPSIKWSLVSVAGLLALMSVIGSMLADETENTFGGIAVALVAFGVGSTPLDALLGFLREKNKHQ